MSDPIRALVSAETLAREYIAHAKAPNTRRGYRCVLHPNAWVAASDLRKAYQEWVKESGETWVLDRTKFANRLKARGCAQAWRRTGAEGKPTRGWEGIGLLAPDPTAPEGV